jgi:8-amino-7-oxononanoate synthase
LDAELAARLAAAAAGGLARSLGGPSSGAGPAGIDFCSNDYLGLSRDPLLRAAVAERLAALPPGAPLGAPASRLLRGNTPLHEALERRLAAFKGTEAALLFPSGYQANVGLLTALIAPGDRALSDALNHASLIDGLRLSGCRRVVFDHLDAAAVERELARPHPGGRTWLVTESLFSMDGDVAPLDVYAALAARHGAELVVDDAHATGLFGAARGSGLCEELGIERRAAAIVSTFGKAAGLAGACVAGSRVLVDFLLSRCRAFVFTTAPPPLLLLGLDAALDRMTAEPERRARALAQAERLRQRLAAHGVARPGGAGPIVPVLLGDNGRALAAADRLAARGFDVRAIRPPTVPAGTARLRISVHADHTEADIDGLAAALADVLGSVPPIGAGAPAEAMPDHAAPESPSAACTAPHPRAPAAPTAPAAPEAPAWPPPARPTAVPAAGKAVGEAES